MKDKSIEDMKKLKDEINIYFKSYFNQFGVKEENNIFELEFEKVYKTIFFKLKPDGTGAKKKYCGILKWKDGNKIEKFDLIGFDSKRSDSPQIGRDFLKEVLKKIVLEEPKDKIDSFVKDFIEKIKNGYFSPEELGLPIGVTKPISDYKNIPIHIRASKIANEKHNAQIKAGDKIKYIYIKGNNNVIAFKTEKQMWKGYEVDYDMMIKRIVDMKISPLYKGMKWEYLFDKFKNKQKTLW